MSYDFNDYKNDSLVKPRNLAWSNWGKFEKVGDKVQGYIKDVFYRPADGQYPEARCITLEQVDGKLINVSIKRLPFVLKDTDALRIGDPLTIELVELKKSETKGFSPTKIYGYYGKNIVPEGKTVYTLEEEDKSYGGTKAPEASEAEKDFNNIKADDVPFK